MDVEQILEELGGAQQLPENAVRAALEAPDSVVPEFMALLKKAAGGAEFSENDEQSLIIGIHILGELREKRAFQPLIDLISRDPDYVDDLLGACITETLPNILISTFDGDTDRVCLAMENRGIEEFTRAALFTLWGYLVLTDEIQREEAQRFLAEFPQRSGAPDGSFVWVSWVGAISELGFQELATQAEEAFADGRIITGTPLLVVLTLDDFRRQLREAPTVPRSKKWMRKRHYEPFQDTISEMSKWRWGSDDERKDTPYTPFALDQSTPTVNPLRQVGRNDPCPCGSGKKFKKCCLN